MDSHSVGAGRARECDRAYSVKCSRMVAPAAAAVIAAMMWFGFVSPVVGEEGLSAIAQDVLRRESTAPGESMSNSIPQVPESLSGSATIATPLDPVPNLTEIPVAREGISVPIPRASAAPVAKKSLAPAAVAGYQSNSGRQAPAATARRLSFSSGVLPPSSGLDPGLKARAAGLRAEGRPFVYAFMLLRARPDQALEQTLASLGVQMLGPHDDHHKVRLPVASLEQVAALPEVEWLGVSTPVQKLSAELTALRGPRANAAVVDTATGIPVVINLFEGDDAGAFRRQLEAAGAALGEYDPALHFYRAVATWPTIDKIAGLDFVLFIELIRDASSGHDQSTPLVDADLIRPGGVTFPPRFGGASTTVGILDTGFMVGTEAAVMHADLNKFGCGTNFTTDAAGVWNDQNGHGTHVLTTIAGTGTANPRYRGVAPDVGSTENRIRAAKIFNSQSRGPLTWMESGMDWMADALHCDSQAPQVINISGGAPGISQIGTDSTSRKLDDKVWTNRQSYVVCSGNSGPTPQTIWTPGVAKNALTVGNVIDNGYLSVGVINNGSSRGPTGDGRMKPNVVAPGTTVTSALAGTTDQYIDDVGCSMATPHVTGLAATLMEHYPEFRDHPALLRAHMMATSIAHDDVTGQSNDYGLGQVSGYIQHWAQSDADGWNTNWFWGGIDASAFQFGDITVPVGAKRLVVVLTWDEPAASAGASRAVTYDLDLWVDLNADCIEAINNTGACGEYASVSGIDNVEYVVVDNPPAGIYRLKATPFNAPSFPLRYGIAAVIIRGDPTPPMTAFMSAPSSVTVGQTFTVGVTVENSSYLAQGVQVEPTLIPLGVTLVDVLTERWDGVTMSFLHSPDALTLGNLVSGVPRIIFWNVRADAIGPQTFKFRAWSENGGQVDMTQTVQVVAPKPNLVQTSMTLNPPAPMLAPGRAFTVTDTVQNSGLAPAASSKTRYYLSLDGVKNAGDTLLTGTRSVPDLASGEASSGTVTVTIPAATPFNAYFLLACADDLEAVAETDEGDNCIASAGAVVTVGRPDLVQNTVSDPPATKARGKSFPVTDTVQNIGTVPSGSSKTRYYLSLNAAKSADDKVLTGIRSVPVLAAGQSHTGTVTVTIPLATTPGTYLLLACADNANTVGETNETNNCKASSTTVIVTP
ncbi:MAG: serine protease [Candidatus Rokuibacteriota bacterium]|nr:MAG: serine protease [Candidatus Rokubacteria bacterium]